MYLEDLIRAGYEIQPSNLTQTSYLRKIKEEQESVEELKQLLTGAIEELDRAKRDASR